MLLQISSFFFGAENLTLNAFLSPLKQTVVCLIGFRKPSGYLFGDRRVGGSVWGARLTAPQALLF